MRTTLALAGESIDRAEEGVSEERIERLFDAHQPRLFRLAHRLAGNREDALDLVQETFVRAARRLAVLVTAVAGK